MADMIEWLAENLSKYNSILLIVGTNGKAENLADAFWGSETSAKPANKVLILSDRDIEYEKKKKLGIS